MPFGHILLGKVFHETIYEMKLKNNYFLPLTLLLIGKKKTKTYAASKRALWMVLPSTSVFLLLLSSSTGG